MEEILFISHKYPPSTGGMEKFSFELVSQFETKPIKIHKLIYNPTESKLMWFLLLRKRVKKLLAEHKNIKLIHLNDGLMSAFCLWLKKEHDVKVVATIHGLDIVFPLGIFQKKIVPQFNLYDKLICVSNATKTECKNRGISEDKLAVILNGVDNVSTINEHKEEVSSILKKHNIPENKNILVGLGRPVKRKGYSWFLENVMPKLTNDFIFILMGPKGKYNDRLWKKIVPYSILKNIELMFGLGSDEMNLRDVMSKYPNNIFRTGYLTTYEIKSLFQISGIFIMPNIKVDNDMEGFGLVALEACLQDCIVLASNIEGITDAIKHGQNGYLLTSAQAQEWADKIIQISDEEHLDQLKKSFKKYTTEHYSWIKMGNEYHDLFQSIIQN